MKLLGNQAIFNHVQGFPDVRNLVTTQQKYLQHREQCHNYDTHKIHVLLASVAPPFFQIKLL